MLHLVSSTQLQNRLIAESYRVLRPGGMFVGTDSTLSTVFRLAHIGDTMVVVDPKTFGQRLESVGFRDISIKVANHTFRFRASR